MNQAIKKGLAVAAVCGILYPGCSTPDSDAYFTDWPAGTSPLEIGKRVSENFIPREHMLNMMWHDSAIHYAEACTWFGALRFARTAGDNRLRERLIRRFDPLLDPANSRIIPMKEHVDFTVWGIVPLELYIQTGDPKYLPLGKEKADRQYENPDASGRSRQVRFWIDDMYMISAIQTQAFRATGDTLYLVRAAQEMVGYLDSLQQDNGLFFHASQGPGNKSGRFHWGRGNGWMAAGMTILLRYLPERNPDYVPIMSGYKKMMAALLKNQDENGMWHQLIDDPGAWPESSCTGMFTYAMVTGVKLGWLDRNRYGPAVRKAWLGLVSHIDEAGIVHDICKGMGIKDTAEGYLEAVKADGDLHGQAPVLWCAVAFLESSSR